VEKKLTTRRIAVIGIMAAMVFVGCYIQFKIPTALGTTRIHFGNIMCLLSGLLFGPVTGGLASGIGSLIFDLFDPEYAPQCWITFILKFVMGFIAGAIAHSKKTEPKFARSLVAGICGQAAYVVLYLTKAGIEAYINASVAGVDAVLAAVGTRAFSSCSNAVLAVVCSLLLLSALRPALKRAGIYQKTGIF